MRSAFLGFATFVLLAALFTAPGLSAGTADQIPIGSYSDLMEIGRSLPSDGDYVQTADIVAEPGDIIGLEAAVSPDGGMILTVTGGPGEFRAYMGGRTAASSGSEALIPASADGFRGPLLLVFADGSASLAMIDGPGTYDSPLCDADAPAMGPFSGTYDGRGHSVSGFTFIRQGGCGLFGIADGAEIMDLSLDGTVVAFSHEESAACDSKPRSFAGMFASEARNSVFLRTSASGTVLAVSDSVTLSEERNPASDSLRSGAAGGICGNSENCEYTACTSEADVSAWSSSMISCSAPGCDPELRNGTYTSEAHAGGICGTSERDSCLLCGTGGTVSCRILDKAAASDPASDASADFVSSSSAGGLWGTAVVSRCCGCGTDPILSLECLSSSDGIPCSLNGQMCTGGIAGRASGCTADSCRLSSDIGSNGIPAAGMQMDSGGVYGASEGCTGTRCLVDGTLLSGRCGSGTDGNNQDWCRGSVVSESAYPESGSSEGMLMLPLGSEHDPDSYITLYGGLWYWDQAAGSPELSTSFRTEFRTEDDIRDYIRTELSEGTGDIGKRYYGYESTLGSGTSMASENCDLRATDGGLMVTPVFDWDDMSFRTAVVSVSAEQENGGADAPLFVFCAVAAIGAAALFVNLKGLL